MPAPVPVPARVRAVSLLALAAATLAAFAGVRANGWVSIDDPAYVTDNPHVRAGLTWEGVRWALTTPHGGNWHPLTSLSHMLDVQLFGLAPGAHHLVNLGLHVLSVLVLALALARLTGNFGRSVFVAALFALHPLRVESVAWVAERKDVLSALFFALTLERYARYAERPGAARLAVFTIMGVLGLLAKPMLVTLPCVLLLLDVWPLGRWPSAGGRLAPLLREKLPLCAAAFVVVAATLFTQSSTGAMTSVESLPLAVRVTNALVSYVRYLGLMVWPAGLAVIHPHPRAAQWGDAAASALLLAGLAAVAYAQRRERPWLAVGGFWYAGMLVPVIGLVQVGRQGFADRYTHLPSIGIALALVWTLASACEQRERTRRVLVAAGVAVLAVLGVLTTRQVARWRDSVTLFEWTVRVTRDNAFAELGLGGALMQAGARDAALPHLARAVQLEPGDHAARERWVTALLEAGRDAEARAALVDGLARHPDAAAFVRLGTLTAAHGDAAEARRAFEAALALAPGDAGAHAGLARLLDAAGESAPALAHYRAWLAARPSDPEALVGTAWLLACSPTDSLRDGAAALALARRAREQSRTRDALLEATFAAAAAEAGAWAEAVPAAESAVVLATRAGANDEAALYRAQLSGYRARRPYRLR